MVAPIHFLELTRQPPSCSQPALTKPARLAASTTACSRGMLGTPPPPPPPRFLLPRAAPATVSLGREQEQEQEQVVVEHLELWESPTDLS